jgi:acyl-CoA reductase-like NAD-dependent aldehyde dehydrogenase
MLARTEQQFSVRNPFNGAELARISETSTAQLHEQLGRASAFFEQKKRPTRAERADVLSRIASLIDANSEGLAHLITNDSGKVISQARKEVQRAITVFKLSAAGALELGGKEIPLDAFAGNAGFEGYYSREPIGVVAGITPFNDPLNLVAHKVGPAIAAGAPIIIKPSLLAPLCSIRLHELVLESGLDHAACQIAIGGADIGEALTCADPVRLISFTGGEATASRIMQTSGLKAFSFDLGGNAPVIITSTADIDHAVESCVSGAFWANGHNCISVQRLIVHDACFEEFTSKFLAAAQALTCGDPQKSETDVGPVISTDHAVRIAHQIRLTAESASSAKLFGGEQDGNVISPAVIVEPSLQSSIAKSELFGPGVTIFRYKYLDAAVELANATPVALNAGVFTASMDESFELINALQFGAVMINESSDFRSDNMPFGGFKRGGIGREGVPFAIQEMTQPKARIFFRQKAIA